MNVSGVRPKPGFYESAGALLEESSASSRREGFILNDLPDFVKEAEAELARRKNFDPKQAAEERKAEMDAMTAKLEQGVKNVFNGDNFKQYLEFCSRLPKYSVNNQILIMLQKPDASLCQSFTGWKEMGRFVKKGEKGIRIMAPAPYKMEKEVDKLDASGKPILDKDGEHVKEKVEVTINAFKPVSTFDISQTDGKEVPQFGPVELTGSVEGYETLFEAIKQVTPVPVSFEAIESGAKGYFHTEENRIAINEGMSEVQNIKTLIHEASHQKLHSKEAIKAGEPKSRNQKETEAESIAFVVANHFGIDVGEYTFPYVASWSSGMDVPELKASLDTIRSVASEMITAIEDKMKELVVQKEQTIGEVKIDPPAKVDTTPDKPIKLTMEKTEEAPTEKPSITSELKKKKTEASKTPKKAPSQRKKDDLQKAI